MMPNNPTIEEKLAGMPSDSLRIILERMLLIVSAREVPKSVNPVWITDIADEFRSAGIDAGAGSEGELRSQLVEVVKSLESLKLSAKHSAQIVPSELMRTIEIMRMDCFGESLRMLVLLLAPTPPETSSADCRPAATESIVHFAEHPFEAWCKADVPNQKTTSVLEHVTCLECQRLVVEKIEDEKQPGSAGEGGEDAPFQKRVADWLLACFGSEIAHDKTERSHRFIEEALELVQCCGITASECHQLVDYVFNRPAGEMRQEMGGVMVTLAALAFAHGMSMELAGETELKRVHGKIEQIREKQANKPKHSPLPQAVAVNDFGKEVE